MPALSPTMEVGTITKWSVEPGTALAPGDVLCEVETDKATVSFEVQEDGVLAKVLVQAGGGEVKVGSPVAVTVEDAAAYEAFKKADAAGEIKLGGDSTADAAAAPAPAAKDEPAKDESKAAGASPKRTVADRFVYAPSARHMAANLGIDATALQGTGKGGRITKADLITALNGGREFPKVGESGAHGEAAREGNAASDKSAIERQAPAPAAAAAAAAAAKAAPAPAAAAKAPAAAAAAKSGPHTDVPANNIRKVIAKRLAQSKAGVPHFYASIECELDGVLALRKVLASKHDVKVSVNDLIIRGAALALRDVPEANAQWSPGAAAALPQSAVDVSVAVATPTGLITPIVTGVTAKGLVEINAAVKDLAGRAKEGKLQPHEFQGGTFTISNLGMFGIDEFSAVINPPQVCTHCYYILFSRMLLQACIIPVQVQTTATEAQ
jgi:pyruvate dehydrogenase E2 component (dihydrolipoamide acetyltransferase)